MKLSHHAKLRMTERTGIPRKNQKQFYMSALKNGKSIGNMKECKLRNYMIQLESTGCKVKYYKGYMFIYSRNSHRLYTMYKVSENYYD